MDRAGRDRQVQSVDGGFGPVLFGDIKKFNRGVHVQSLVEILAGGQYFVIRP